MNKRSRRILGLLILGCVIVTNFIVSGGLPVAKATEEASVDPGTNRYYENDFDENADGLTLLGGATRETEDGNGYIKLTAGTKFLWNYFQEYDLSDYVIFEVDVASTKHETVFIKAVGQGATHSLVTFRTDGTITPSNTSAETKMANSDYINVAVLVNTADNTYSVWLDETQVVSGSSLPDGFGPLIYWQVEMSGGSATASFLVDNMKVYNGLTPADFENTTVPGIDNTRDESWMDEYLGTQSSLLDYGNEVLSLLDSSYPGAIVIHTSSNYVYQNGTRIKKTAAEVESLLSSNSDNIVYENGQGLVIINSSGVTLTEENIESLQSYMIYTRPLRSDLNTLFESITTNEHPRIVINQEKMDQIISDYATNDLVKGWGDQVIAYAEATINGGTHVEYTRPDGTRMTSCRAILDRALNLSMAYKLTGKAEYKNFLWEDLKLAGEFEDWNNDLHYLDTGEFAAGFAIAYDWLYDVWTEEERTFLEEAIYNNGLYFQHRMQYGLESGSGTYIASETNRNAVTNGGLGLAALAVFDVYPEKCADILEKIYHSLEIMMNEFSPDGANTEGPAYWEYMMRFLSKFMASTELTFGTDFNIYKAPGFETTGDYYLDIDGMSGANNFHDATELEHTYQGYLFWVSNALDKPELTKALLFKMELFGLSGDIYSLIFYDSDIQADGETTRPLDSYYRNVELVNMRSSWIKSTGISVSIHSGQTIVSHAHIDSGTFVLDIGGQRFAGDIGMEDYNLAAIGENRYYYYRIRPEGHNVFVINPDTTGEDLGQSISSNAHEVVSEFVSKEKGSYAILPLDSYYVDYAESATRGLMLGDERKSVLIRDEIRGMTLDENKVYWFMQMEDVTVEIAEDKRSAILSKGGVDVHLQVLSDNATDWEIQVLDTTEMYPKAGLADQENQTENTGWSRLAIIFTAGKDLNINVKMAQLNDTLGDTPIEDVSLADWEIEDGHLDVISVDITWGDMAFTYEDGTWDSVNHQWEGRGWEPSAENSNLITVKNIGNVVMNMTLSYESSSGYEGLSGGFVDSLGTQITSPVALAAGSETSYRFKLFGTTKTRWADDEYKTVGTITITIE